MPTDDTLERLRRGLGQRYAVECAVGQGGTATVYRARDLKHDRTVAIKVLRSEISEHLSADRFLREIGIVARLTHPHILPLHDSGTLQGLLYYVTPFFEGASLADRLAAEQQLSVPAALRLAAELADGLAYAHAHGVVHRDVKPGNILLEGPHAVLCDFGIARGSGPSTPDTITSQGVVIGTPLYMSPEQCVPDRPVDGRSDVFSLGCVLYESIVGEPPFGAVAPRVLAAQKAAGIVRASKAGKEQMPDEVGRLVERMLAPLPADRPTAAECLRELQVLSAEHVVAGDVNRTRTRRLVRSPLFSLALGACLAAILLILGRRVAILSPGLDPDRIVVGVFQNQTGDAALDHLGDMTVDWVTHGLQRARFADVVPSPTALAASRYALSSGGDPLRGLAAETGAGIVVSGAYYLSADTLRFTIQVTDLAERTNVPALEAVEGPVDRAETVIDRVRERVAGSLATVFDREFTESLGPEIRPPTYEAYRSFMAGMELYTRNRPAEAIPWFGRAFEQDSTFLTSLLLMALNYSNMRQWSTADSILGYVAQRRDELTPYDRLWLDYRRFLLAGDRPSALEAIRKAAEMAPGSKAVYNYASESLENGRPGEAIAALSSVEPERGAMRGWLSYWWLQAEIYHFVGDLEAERRVAERAAELYPDRLVPISLLARGAAARGDLATVMTLLDRARGLREDERGPSLGLAYIESGRELHAHGFGSLARRVFQEAVEWYASLPPEYATAAEARAVWAWALYRLGSFEEARRQSAALVEEHPEDSDYWLLLGLSAIRVGDDETATAVWRELRSRSGRPYQFGRPQVYQARMAALSGDRSGALDLLGDAFEAGWYHGLWSHVAPEFDSLRGSRAFLELTGPPQPS